MQKKCSIALLAALSAAAATAAARYVLGAEAGLYSAWMLFFALAWAGGQKFWMECDGRARACFGTAGGLLMLAMALGWRLQSAGETGWTSLAACAVMAVCLGPCAGFGMLWLSRRLENLREGRCAKPVRVFWTAFGLILLGWLPVLLAYFPGCYGYDLDSQLTQAVYGGYTTHHPLLHTLMVGSLYNLGGWLGDHTIGALLYTVLQMLLLAAALAYALMYLAQKGCPRWVRLGLTTLFALAPVHSLHAIGAVKDVPFAAAMTVCLVEIHKLACDRERLRSPRKMALLAGMLVLACLLRNNAVMAVAAFAIIALLLMGRGWRMRTLAVLAAALVAYAGASAGLKAATGAVDGLINEALSVPAQQLSRVYDKYGLDEPVGYEIIEWVPHAEDYAPARADFVKLHLQVHREGEMMGFLKFWIREFFHYPIEYIDAFLLNAQGYWYPDDTTVATIYEPWSAVITVHQRGGFGVDYTSRFPWLKALYNRLFSDNEYMQSAALQKLITPSSYTWLLVWVLAWAIWRRKRGVMMAGWLMLMYLLTLFLGPCALLRYAYYLMIGAPVLAALMCTSKA